MASGHIKYNDPSGHCVFAVVDTIICLVVALKLIDWGWTAYDMWQSARTLRNPNSSNEERLFALLNISLAVVLEAAEPDEFLPISVPADDLARKGVIGYARQLVKTRDLKSLPADLPDWMRHMARDIANEALALEGLNLKKNTNKVFGMVKGK